MPAQIGILVNMFKATVTVTVQVIGDYAAAPTSSRALYRVHDESQIQFRNQELHL